MDTLKSNTVNDTSASSERLRALIKGHSDFLNFLEKRKFYFDIDSEFLVGLHPTVIHEIFEKMTDDTDLLKILQGHREILHQTKLLIRNYLNLSEEVGSNKKLGLIVPSLISIERDKVNILAPFIYPLEYENGKLVFSPQPFLTFEKFIEHIETNFPEYKDKLKEIPKNWKSKAIFCVDSALLIYELFAEVSSLTIPGLGILLLPYKFHEYYAKHIRKDKKKTKATTNDLTEAKAVPKTHQFKDFEIGYFALYDDTSYLRNCIRDFRDIEEKIDDQQVIKKLSKIFEDNLSAEEDQINLTYIQRRFLPLHKGRNLENSQRFNYGRMLLQDITAIEGPPGTGKTEVIASFCLDRIFERLLDEFKNGDFSDSGSYTVLVTSTNNKAVDNVFGKLEKFDESVSSKISQNTQYLKGYLRLGSKEYFDNITKELEKFFVDTPEEIDINEKLAILKDEINRLLPEVEEYKGKEESLYSLKKALLDCERRIETCKQEKKEIEDLIEALTSRLFTGSDKARVFTRDNLATFRDIFSKLPPMKVNADWISRLIDFCYEHLPLLSKRRKKTLYDFATHRGLKISGLEDFQFLSCREIYLRNTDFVKELERFIEKKEKVDSLNSDLVSLKEEKEKLERDMLVTESYLKEKRDSYEDRVVELFIKLREYAFWKLKSDSNFLERLRKLRDDIQNKESPWRYHRDILRISPMVISTALSVRNTFPCQPEIFETVIVDEASQTLLSYGIPLFIRGMRFVSIGDQNQLEPVKHDLTSSDKDKLEELFSKLPDHLHYDRSVQQAIYKIDKTDRAKKIFREHFRCNRNIIQFCDNLVGYGLDIRTKDDDCYRFNTSFSENSPLQRVFSYPLAFVNVDGKAKQRDGSWYNEEEIKFITSFIESLRKHVDFQHLAVLTPFRPQVEKIHSNHRIKNSGIVVGTVHKLQGDEREIVLMSVVLTNPVKIPTSLWNNKKLVNVAVSRAKKHFILIGNQEALESLRGMKANKDNPLCKLYSYILKNGVSLNASDLVPFVDTSLLE